MTTPQPIPALVIATDGVMTDIELPPTPVDQLAALYAVIDCDALDVVRLTEHLDMWVDDEGMIIDAPVVNMAATILAHHFGRYSQLYFGTVVLTGAPNTNGDITPLTTALADHIRGLLTAPSDERETS